MEKAAARKGQKLKRSINSIPLFRLHLEREGIDFGTWQKRQQLVGAPDVDNEALNLSKRKVLLNKRSKP